MFNWSDERIGVLTRLWSEGVSVGDIAAQLRTGRNAVVGKAHRLGLPEHANAGTGGPKPKRIVRHNMHFVEASAASVAPELPAMPPPPIGTVRLVTLFELQSHHCRWPFGDGPILFCGGDAVDGKPYCAGHCAVAYRGYWN